jgi:hypothetical protein
MACHPAAATPRTETPSPQTADAFFADCWERRPRVFKATPARAALAARLTTLPTLLGWLAAAERAGGGRSPLRFARDVNAARYLDGVRETPNGVGDAGAEELKALHDEDGCTLQVRLALAAAGVGTGCGSQGRQQGGRWQWGQQQRGRSFFCWAAGRSILVGPA